ncbi:hypothetical protein [Gluconobacter japonicus]|uniref:Uncharacterized protein n=1 Tax=Gluconobacter japonicus TaxID=376620 RepID=A0ABQ5WJA5_GLUJA|nr:hypothetical protein [Gluconobacter japonicus]GBR25438.1 hypothetical protein AA3271_2031 [Gluconobacter japonicus NBRC 3271]GLQ59861.1 hypothetical protein GCM10010937_16640 [Gluconobacter japonicus]
MVNIPYRGSDRPLLLIDRTEEPPAQSVRRKWLVLAMLTRYAACAWLRSRRCAPHLRHPLRPGRREGIKEKE